MRHLSLLGLAVLLGGAAHVTGEKAQAVRSSEEGPDPLMYLPEGHVLRMASLGHRNMIADFVWLGAIQYYGEQKITGQNYDQAERLFQVIYDLDDTFKGATRFGALVLSQDAGDPDGALDLLARAQAEHPEDWEYVFDEAFVHQTIVRDYEAAGEAYRRASTMEGAPSVAARLAGLSFARLGDRDAAREVWWAVLEEADNELTQQVAERNLKNLDMEDAQELLTEAAQRFQGEHGRLPADWNEVTATGLLERVPEEPFGGAYYLDAETVEVWATTVVDRRMSAIRDHFTLSLRKLEEIDGEYPASLEVVVERGLQRFPPWRPFGITVDYDRLTGTVSWNPPWPETEPGRHGASSL
jgi:tetratricopeptide (TPR) repeat protein